MTLGEAHDLKIKGRERENGKRGALYIDLTLFHTADFGLALERISNGYSKMI